MHEDYESIFVKLNDIQNLLEQASNLYPSVKYEHQQQQTEFLVNEALERINELLSELEY